SRNPLPAPAPPGPATESSDSDGIIHGSTENGSGGPHPAGITPVSRTLQRRAPHRVTSRDLVFGDHPKHDNANRHDGLPAVRVLEVNGSDEFPTRNGFSRGNAAPPRRRGAAG